MNASDREPPPKYFGDHPHGVYWSAERSEMPENGDVLDVAVTGDVIAFMWDYGVVVPLWDQMGLLPEEPEWLQGVLDLSEPLVRDLAAWGEAMEHLDGNPPLRTADAYRDLDERAKALVNRLQDEVGARFTITYKSWR